ncbi:MAG: glycine reductase [Pseudomonadota bacterium]
MARTRAWYLALGYPEPYRWASLASVPFQPLQKPLSACRLGLVTTAAPVRPDAGDQGPRAPYNGKAKFFEVYAAPTTRPPALGIAHVAIDRAHTTAEDPASYFPLAAYRRAAARGAIGAVADRFYGLPTDRSVRTTTQTHAPKLVELCRADRIDVAVLVPNCPVCHQSVALTAHALEAAGVATVILGCALDIVEHVGVPRLLFSDLPLGNASGPPHDTASQDTIALTGLELLAAATAPRTTWRTAVRWPGAADWRLDYANPDRLTAAELAEKRAEFERVKTERDSQPRARRD